MTRDEFDAYCDAKIGTSHVIQWGGASVWKVGGKIFAIASNLTRPDQTNVTEDPAPPGAQGKAVAGFQPISFKCSDLAYEVLPEQEGIIPAPYLARAKWVQLVKPDAMSDEDIKLHLDAAYDIVAKKLTQKLRADLGIVL